MWAVAENIGAEVFDRKGETSIAGGDLFQINEPDTLLSLRFKNKTLTGIVNAIQQTGLGSLQDIYMCIIPPLSRFQKLPVMAAVDFVRQRTREYELHGRWEALVPLYIRLFRECKTLGLRHRVFLRATAILINLFMSIGNTLQVREDEKRTDEVNDLRKRKKEIMRELDPESQKREDEIEKLEGGEGETPGELSANPEVQSRSGCSMRDVMQNFAKLSEVQGRQNDNLWTELLGGKSDNSSIDPHGFFKHDSIFSEVMDWYYTRHVPSIKNQRDVFDRSPLHYAAQGRNVVALQSLLKDSPDPNATDLAEWSALHYAIHTVDENRAKSLESTIWALLGNGADTEVRGRDGICALHCAARQPDDEATSILLQAGASVDIQDNSRKTPLHWAAYTGNVEAISTLLRKGAYGGARDDYGRIPLHIAAVTGKLGALAELLKDKGVEINSKDRNGRNALHLAAMGRVGDTVDLLLKELKNRDTQQLHNTPHSTNVCKVTNARDNAGGVPLEYAVVFQPTMQKALWDNTNEKKQQKSFIIAVVFGRYGIVESALSRLSDNLLRVAHRFAKGL